GRRDGRRSARTTGEEGGGAAGGTSVVPLRGGAEGAPDSALPAQHQTPRTAARACALTLADRHPPDRTGGGQHAAAGQPRRGARLPHGGPGGLRSLAPPEPGRHRASPRGRGSLLLPRRRAGAPRGRSLGKVGEGEGRGSL